MAKKSDSFMPGALRPYWRYEYAKVAGPHRGDPFKGLKKADPKKALIVIKGKLGALVLNKFPYTAGHLLAVAYRAVGALEDLTGEERDELMDLVITGKLLLKKVLKTHGTNIGINQGEGQVSGGSVPNHLHWHIIPRWRGDNSFFPVMTGSRILITSQENVWKALRKEYSRVKI